MKENKAQLERSLGLIHATASNMATMVGIGPFITIPLIVSAMGGPQAMLGWFVGAIIAISDGQVWAELSTSLPGEGGSYVYLREAYSKYFGRLAGFLFVWTFLLSGPLEIASGFVGMVQYASYIWPLLNGIGIRIIAFLVGVFTIVLHYNRVKFVGTVTVILWIVMLITAGITVAVGLSNFNAQTAFNFPKGWFSFSWGFVSGLGSATLIAMYDLMGYYNICYIEEEVRRPEYVFPRAIIFSVIGVTLIYAVMNISILGTMPWQQIAKSEHVVSDMFGKFLGNKAAVFLTILVIITAYGSTYSLMMSYSRLPYAAARDGFFFKWLGEIHLKKHFPHFSLLTIGFMTCFASLFNLDFIIGASISSRILIQFLGQIVGLTLLRKDRPDLRRPFKMWLYPVPSIIAFIGFSFIFMSSGLEAISLGLAWMILGAALYFLWNRRNEKITDNKSTV
ncbi:MAG: APC family permease [Candidatus Kryptoniota bacterium]